MTDREAPAAPHLPRILLAALFALALLPRLLLLFELRNTDYFRYPSVDELEYREWASAIAGGEVVGHGVFYASPVYPYLLGTVFAVTDGSVLAGRAVNVVLGAARAPIVAAAGTALFGPGAGLAAGVIAALYRTTAFYDVFLLKESLALFLQDAALLVLIVLLGRMRSGRGSARARLVVASGMLVGIASLAREALAPFIGLAAALIAWTAWRGSRGTPRGAVVPAALFLLGAFLALLPVAIRNKAVGGEFVLLSAQGGQNLYLGNSLANRTGLATFPENVRSDPMSLESDFRALASHKTGRELGSSETSAYWLRETLREMGSDPAHAARLLARKALLALNAFEIPNVYSLLYFSRLAKSLAWNPVRFGVVFPIAVLGILAVLADRARRGRAAAPLLLLATAYGTLVAFYVTDRYRLPMMTPLFLFAGAGLAAGVALVRRARVPRETPHPTEAIPAVGAEPPVAAPAAPSFARRAAIGVLVLAAAFAVTKVPLIPRGSRGDAMPPANLANSLAKMGRYDEALALYEEAFRIEPETDFALFGAATVYADVGRHDEAIGLYRKYLAKNPGSSQAWYNLGSTYYEMGKPDSAVIALQRAVAVEPYYAEAHFNLGAVLQTQGDLEGARSAYETAVRSAPTLARAWNNLGVVLMQMEKPAEGRPAFERAAAADSTYVEPRMHLAGIAMGQGNGREAAAHYEWVIAHERRLDALLGLARAHIFANDLDAARRTLEMYLRVAPEADPSRADAQRMLTRLTPPPAG